MPRYCLQCLTCGENKDVFRPIKDRDLPEPCKCGKQMTRDLIAEHGSVRGDYSTPIVSDSLAFDAIDLTEHRRRFPGIDVVVDHARSARPVLRNLNEKRKYLRARGFTDCNSFI